MGNGIQTPGRPKQATQQIGTTNVTGGGGGGGEDLSWLQASDPARYAYLTGTLGAVDTGPAGGGGGGGGGATGMDLSGAGGGGGGASPSLLGLQAAGANPAASDAGAGADATGGAAGATNPLAEPDTSFVSAPSTYRQGLGTRIPPQLTQVLAGLRKVY